MKRRLSSLFLRSLLVAFSTFLFLLPSKAEVTPFGWGLRDLPWGGSYKAYGRVSGTNGNLVSGRDLFHLMPLVFNGFVSSERISRGCYRVTYTTRNAQSPTRFGTDELPFENFHIETTIAENGSGSSICTGAVVEITDRSVIFEVRVVELADQPTAIDRDFFFGIRIVNLLDDPASFLSERSSHHLLGLGSVGEDGRLVTGFGVNEVKVKSSRTGAGAYSVKLQCRDGFAGDKPTDYFLHLTLAGSGTKATVIRGDVVSVVSDHEVEFRICTDNLRPSGFGSATMEDVPFQFSVSRVPWENVAFRSQSSQQRAFAVVDGLTGDLAIDTSFYEHGTISSRRTAPGRYTVVFDAPKRGTDVETECFVPFVSLSADVITKGGITISRPGDRVASATVVSNVDGKLTVEISVNSINDRDLAGRFNALPADNDFLLCLFDSRATHLPDLMIAGLSPAAVVGGFAEDDSLRPYGKLKGGGIFNSSGSGQTVVRSKRKARAKRDFGNCLLHMGVRSTSGGAGVDGLRLRALGNPRSARFYKTRANDGEFTVLDSLPGFWIPVPELPELVTHFDWRENVTARVRIRGSITDKDVMTRGRDYDEYFILATKLFSRSVRDERRGRQVEFRLSLASEPAVIDVTRVVVGR